MIIDGKAIAEELLTDLAGQVEILKGRGIIPTLAVILIGDNPASISYIKQKQKAAERIGAKLVLRQASSVKRQELTAIIEQYNEDLSIHGLIVQRPVPTELGDVADILSAVAPQKDVDGFVPNSPFDVPVAAAVWRILQSCHPRVYPGRGGENPVIVILGRGETAGKPIAEFLAKQGHKPTVVHSQTLNPETCIKDADVLISCVGKPHTITKNLVKPGAILISVGLTKNEEGKLHGDYEEDDIKNIASFYTTTPGGVGPVNVACLMQNLVSAASKVL